MCQMISYCWFQLTKTGFTHIRLTETKPVSVMIIWEPWILTYLHEYLLTILSSHLPTWLSISTYIYYLPSHKSTQTATYPTVRPPTQRLTRLWLSPWLYVKLLVSLLAWLTLPKMTDTGTENDIVVIRKAHNHTTEVAKYYTPFPQKLPCRLPCSLCSIAYFSPPVRWIVN